MVFKLHFCHSASIHFTAEMQLKNHRLSQRQHGEVVKLRFTLGLLAFLFPIMCLAELESPYEKIVISHRMAKAARLSVENKLNIWEEPLKTKISEKFSENNLIVLYASILQKHIEKADAEAIATFLNSSSGKKLVAYSVGEYDLKLLSESEKQEMKLFENSHAGKSYIENMSKVSKESLELIKQQTQDLVNTQK